MTRLVWVLLWLVFAGSTPAAAQALRPASPAPTPPSPAPTPATPARHSENGRPFIRAYRPTEVGGAGQIWSILQDRRGVMYIGTNGAVLEFDGSSWRRIRLEPGGAGRSLALDPSGRIYVGSASALGYLAPDEHGDMAFVSLVSRLPEDARSFNDVWRTFVTSDGVFFQTERGVFKWAEDRFTVIKPASRFNRASLVDGKIYLTMPETGLNVLEGDRFRALPGTESLGLEPFPVVLRYDDKRLLIGTRQRALFLYDGATLVPFPTELDTLAIQSQLYRGVAMPDGSIALTTTSGGMGIIDRQGRRVTTVSRANGLPSDVVYFAMPDREGSLWLGLDNGMARVETPSPLSFFNEADGLPGYVNRALRHDGRLYLALQTGVYYLEPASGPTTNGRFEQVAGVANQCWWLTTLRDPLGVRAPTLAAACTAGLYEITGTRATPIKALADLSFRPNVLRVSQVDPGRVWAGLFDGLASFRWRDGRWIDEGTVDGVTEQVRSLYENADGSLWLGTNNDGAIRVTFDSPPVAGAPRPAAKLQRFGAAAGLPPGGAFVEELAGAPYFAVGDEKPYVVRFDTASNTFTRDPAFDVVEVDAVGNGFGIVGGPGGRAYVGWGRNTVVLQKGAGDEWAVDRKTFGRFGTNAPPNFVYPEDGVVWMMLDGGRLVRFDTTHAVAVPKGVPTLIRSVTTQAGRRLFGGSGAALTPELDASASALRIEYSAPSYLDETATEYQSRLDNLEPEWSPWTREARRDYTNLGFGDYRFRVRGRSISGEVTEEAVFAFSILPPWYRTWWAYLAYVTILGGAVLLAARVQHRRLVAKERERAHLAQTRLRAEAAEALARSESDGKKNVELLSEIGREITASLDFDTIFGKLYSRVNDLADAQVFGVGLYHADRKQIEYRLAIERGKRYAPYSRDTSDPNQLPVWCIEHREPVFINDVRADAGKYIRQFEEQSRLLEDGTMSEEPQSIIYMPLIAKERVLGIITIQSFKKNAYTEHHLNVMQSLASYTAIALDNANAYRQLNEQEHEIRRLFEEAERARAVAEEADAAKSSFLSTVSHELRTPLTSVLGFAKIIKKRLEDRIFPLVRTDDRKVLQTIQQVEDNLRVVVSEGERLTKLIDDVLDLAKIEAGKLEWHMEPASVLDVVDRATAATSSLLDQKKLRLVTDIAPGLPSVTGDRDRLIQVLINLISNAVKFTDAGTITCRAERRGDELVVSVIDTGMGISPSDQPKVFERFKQVGDTLTDKPKGTGLGLPICREIVEHHGGRIWVTSEIGVGSTFSFSLPVSSTQGLPGGGPVPPVELAALIRQLREQVTVTTPRTAEHQQPRILVVDDDPNIRELLTQEFSEAGYQVIVAGNGREALVQVRNERPDLIVLDVMMPEMNGFDVAAVLKNDPATMSIPIVILSIVEDQERGFRLGVDRYLTKPIDTELLFREVGSLIEQKTSHKRVLVVDEDESTVRTLADVLKARGYTVLEARGEDLLERAVALQPDIIMLNSVSSARSGAVQMLRFEKGMENVLFLLYQ